ncbi:MAG: hypothetical protein F6K17_07405 [Okeania sp. SIO3C4]|nr:hypothetical protein [Okeania sp. SIO3C4]
MLDFPPADLAELSGAENLKYLNFVILGMKLNVLLFLINEMWSKVLGC